MLSKSKSHDQIFCCLHRHHQQSSGAGASSSSQQKRRQNALLAAYGVDSVDRIIDRFTTYQEVTEALRKAGLEVCSLIFGIDYTLSNNTQGQRTFGGRSLHTINPQVLNPYQQVICYLGETVS